MRQKIQIAILVVLVALIALWGCPIDKKTSDSVQREQTERALSEMQRQIGMPNITNFQQRKLMKMIYELADKENLVTYVYIKSDYQGKLMFIGKAIGFGVPFSAQFTNPEKVVHGDHQLGININGYHLMKLPQADPNGLFMPVSSSATWIMMIDPATKKPRPVYIEPEIVVSPFPLHKVAAQSGGEGTNPAK